MMPEIIIDMGRLVVIDRPVLLTSLGLGSCIGLALYDSVKNVSGFAHIMLPDSSRARFPKHDKSSVLALHKDGMTQAIKHKLLEYGYDVKAVIHDSKYAVIKFREFSPFLMMCESDLPPTDAFPLLDEILETNRSANIVIAENGQDSRYVEFLSKGAVDVIKAPFTAEKLNHTMEFISKLRFMRFADVAIDVMISRMLHMGCRIENIKAKMIGGAHMFSHSQVSIRNIGRENIGSVRSILASRNIPIVAEIVGGSIGRTVRFDTGHFSAEITSKEGKIKI